MKSAVTISLVPEARGGPFVFWDGLADGFARAAALGFDAVEIFPPSARDLDAGEIEKLCARHHLKVAAMGTGGGWVKHKLRLTDPDPAVRHRARTFIGEIVDCAARFGAPAIVGSMQGRVEGEVTREQAVAWLAEGLEELGARAQTQGVPLLYEFLNRYETNLFTRVFESAEFLKKLRTKNVKLLCDLFHMNLEEADIAGALRLAGPQLGHVHFADSNRQAMGFGHTDVESLIAVLREIGYQGYLSAEILPLPNSQAAAEQAMRGFRRALEPGTRA
jgi:sugar phosphate isomerase/epimerase